MLLWSPTSQGRLLVQSVHTVKSPNQTLWPLVVSGAKGRTGALPPYPHPTQETKLCSLRPIAPSVTSPAHTQPVACRMSSYLRETPKRIWWGVGGSSRERHQEGRGSL